MRRILVLAPHGDDEVLGCGATIAKHIESSDIVTVALIRNSYDERSKIQLRDAVKSSKILGVHSLRFLNLNEQELHNINNNLIDKLEKLIYEIKPDTIYSTFYGDLHQDHRKLFEALNSAARIWSKHRVDNIFLYQTISSTDQGILKNIQPFVPNYFVPLKERHIKIKANALQCYTQEIRDSNHPRSVQNIIDNAKILGREIKEDYAEAFVAIRIIPL